MTGKILNKRVLCLLLVSLLVFGWAMSCSAAEQMYMVSESQLQRLELNNKQLATNNSEQLIQLEELKKQLAILRQELSDSKEALTIAQQSLERMKVSTKQLESKLRVSNISPTVAYGNKSGIMIGLKFRSNQFYDVTIVGNSKSFVMGVSYNL